MNIFRSISRGQKKKTWKNLKYYKYNILTGVLEYAARLEEDIFACENYAARRIQWEMEDARRLFLASRRIAFASGRGGPRQSFFSPPFSCSGVRNLQIELQLKFKQVGKDSKNIVHVGEISIFLWAPKGSHIWFRIFLNEKCRAFEGTEKYLTINIFILI